jgi:adenylate kinase
MKNIIVLMGGQGSGKGTIAALMREKHNYDYIETGALFRDLPADSEIGQMIARGELVPDDKLFELVGEKLAGDKDALLDGFPRTLAQAQWLSEISRDADIKIIYLNVPRDLMMARIQKRISEGAGRADDADAAAVAKRIDSFFNKTMPAIEFLRDADGVEFFDIDGRPTPADIMEEIICLMSNE